MALDLERTGVRKARALEQVGARVCTQQVDMCAQAGTNLLLVRKAQAEVDGVLFPGQAAPPGAGPAEPNASNAGAAGSADASPEPGGQQAPVPADAVASAEASPELEGGDAPVPAAGEQAPVPADAVASAAASPELEGGDAPVPAAGEQALVQQAAAAMAAAGPAVVAQAVAPGICTVSKCCMYADTAARQRLPAYELDVHTPAVPQHAVPRPP